MLPASTSSTELPAVRSDKEPIVHSAIREVAGPSAAQRIIRFAIHDQGYLQGIRQQHQWGPQEAGPLYLGMAGTLENSILLFAVKSHFYALATDPVATKQLFCRAAQNYSALEELEKKPMPWDKAKRVGELISIQALTVPPTKAGHDWLMVDVYVHELATPAAGADPLHAGRTLWYDRSA